MLYQCKLHCAGAAVFEHPLALTFPAPSSAPLPHTSQLYYRNLYAFIELVRMVQEYQTMARQCGANQQGAAAYIWSPCWHLMVHR